MPLLDRLARAARRLPRLNSGVEWKPLGEVKQELGGLSELPPEVVEFGRFMKQQTGKELSKRDLIKAYTITRSSVQRGDMPADKIRGLGLDVSTTGERVRPEGAFSDWLMTDAGQGYLDKAEKGVVDEKSLLDLGGKFSPFGLVPTLQDDLRYAAKGLPMDPARVSDMVKAADAGETQVGPWREMMKGVKGIGPAKTGFVGSMVGYGELPTLDARQISLQTLDPKAVKKLKGPRADMAVDELAERQRTLLDVPPDLEPQGQHLRHHAIWDRAAGERTTHDDLIRAMKVAGVGGAAATGLLAEGDEAEAAPLLRAALPDIERTVRNLGRAEMKPRSWEDFHGKTLFSALGDRTDAGLMLDAVEGRALNKPVELQGGPRYGTQADNPYFWASARPNIAPKAGNLLTAREKGLDPIFGYTAMGTPSSDFAHMTGAVYTGMIDPSKVSKSAAATYDQTIRDRVDPTWPGLLSDSLDKHWASLGAKQRNALIDILDKKGPIKAGLPDMAKVRAAIRDPGTNAIPWLDTGYMIGSPGEGKTVKSLIGPETKHGSYDTGLLGKVEGSAPPLPPEIAFRDVTAHKLANPSVYAEGPKAGQEAVPLATDAAWNKALMGNPSISQKIDDQFLEESAGYLGELEKRGGTGTLEGAQFRLDYREKAKARLKEVGLAAAALAAGTSAAAAEDIEPEMQGTIESRIDETPDDLLATIMAEPELVDMFAAHQPQLSIDDQGNATRTGLVPQYSLDDIAQAAQSLAESRAEAENDPNVFRGAMRKGLGAIGAPESLRNRITSDMDWAPGWGLLAGLEDSRQSLGAAGTAFGEGRYKDAAIEGGIGLTEGLLSIPSAGSAGKIARKVIRR